MADSPDLSAIMNSVLSDPQAMERLKGIAESIGLAPTEQTAPTVTPGNTQPDVTPGTPTIPLQQIGELLPLLGGIGQEDDSMRLLNSLRPFLGEERRARLDEAARLLTIIKVIGTIKGEGLL